MNCRQTAGMPLQQQTIYPKNLHTDYQKNTRTKSADSYNIVREKQEISQKCVFNLSQLHECFPFAAVHQNG